MNFTDLCFFIVLVVTGSGGAYRGLLRTIIKPAAFIVATAIALLYFKITKNGMAAIAIGITGPILLGWLCTMILNRTLLKNKTPVISALSRVLGLLINAFWGGLMFLCVIALLVIIPLDTFGFGDINTNAKESMTYKICQRHFESIGIIPKEEARKCMSGACSMSEKNKEKLAADADIQNIMNDPRVLKLISDPAMQAAIEKQDYAAILSNPIIFELGQDPAFIGKALRAYPKIKEATK